MKEKLKDNFNNSKAVVALIIGIGTIVITTFGAAFAYFSVTANNDATATKTTGALKSTGDLSLTTNTSELFLNLDGVAMNKDNIGVVYYATTNSNGTPITIPTSGNGIYTLATASLAKGDTKYNCNYSYDISATTTLPITDGSDEDIIVAFKGASIAGNILSYTLKQLTTATQTLTGTFTNITTGAPQTITIESSVTNSSDIQDNFAGNGYQITVTPKASGAGFSCTPVA